MSQRVTSTPQPQGWADRSQSQSSFAHTSGLATPTASMLDRSSLRPLTQAFKGAQTDYEVSEVIDRTVAPSVRRNYILRPYLLVDVKVLKIDLSVEFWIIYLKIRVKDWFHEL